jgi:hypothetical protein
VFRRLVIRAINSLPPARKSQSLANGAIAGYDYTKGVVLQPSGVSYNTAFETVTGGVFNDGRAPALVGTHQYCPTRHRTHFEPSFLELNDIL